MKCPKCGKSWVKRRNYSPSKGYEAGFTYSHIYSLSQLLNDRNLCKYTVTTTEGEIK